MQVAVEFVYQTSFSLPDEPLYVRWLTACAKKFKATSVDIAIAFMNDKSLQTLNAKHLDHDAFTDVITFDDSVGKDVVANIAISTERVFANAKAFSQTNEEELRRVMAHGLLHCLGYNDKNEIDKHNMEVAETICMKLFRVEHKTSNHVL